MSELNDDMRKNLIEQHGMRVNGRMSPIPITRWSCSFNRFWQSLRGCKCGKCGISTCMCAERVAVYKAVSEGEHNLTAIAIVTENGGMPCGSCRQVMAEFNHKLTVIIANENGQILKRLRLRNYFQMHFYPGI